MKWKDVSRFSRNDTERAPNCFEIRAGRLWLTVHRHVHYRPDQWLASFEPFFRAELMNSTDAEEAKVQALGMARGMLDEAHRALCDQRAKAPGKD